MTKEHLPGPKEKINKAVFDTWWKELRKKMTPIKYTVFVENQADLTKEAIMHNMALILEMRGPWAWK